MDVLPFKHKKSERAYVCHKYFDKKELGKSSSIQYTSAMTAASMTILTIASNVSTNLSTKVIGMNPASKKEDGATVATRAELNLNAFVLDTSDPKLKFL
jgi:hypothetical protein